MSAAAPWAVVEADPDRVAGELARRFPGVSVWAGEYTGGWWAMVRDRSGRDRLVEAPTPAELGHLLQKLAPRNLQAGPRYSRASLRNGTAGRMPPRPSPAPWPPRASRPVVPPVTVPRHIVRKRRGGWLRRMLGSLVALEG